MLTLETIKGAISEDLKIESAGSFTRFILPNGDFLADLQLETGRVYSSIDLLTTQIDDVETEEDDYSMLIDGYADAFHSEFLPAWKSAGFTLDCVEDASADPNYIMVTARIETTCPDVGVLVERLNYLRGHLYDASGAISFL